MDLAAAAVIAAIALFMAIESLRLPVPGGIFTAPGLLPFLTSASLLVMAVLLGYSALQRRRTMPRALDRFEIPDDSMRSLTLGGIVILYVLGLQFVPVRRELQHRRAAFRHRRLRARVAGGHSPACCKLYWRAPLWACLAVTVGVDRVSVDRLPHAVPDPLALRPRAVIHAFAAGAVTLSAAGHARRRRASASSGAPCRGSPPPWR